MVKFFTYMSPFNNKRPGGFKKSFGGPKRSFGGGRPPQRGGSSFGGRDRGQSEKFAATCHTCGKACEVPFRPSGDRPVFCRDCFDPQTTGRKDSFAPRQSRDTDSRSSYAPERPTTAPAATPALHELIARLDTLTITLNRIAESLVSIPAAATPAVVAATPRKKAAPTKKVKKTS